MEGLSLKCAEQRCPHADAQLTALVEPSQFQTSLFGKAVAPAEPIGDYEPFIAAQAAELKGSDGGGPSPSVVADLLVEISHSDGSQFRYPVGDTAERVSKIMFAQSDQERQDLLRNVSNVDWWIDGKDAPPQ